LVTGTGAVTSTRADDPGGEEVLDHPDLVVDADPTLPLTARPEASAERELEQRQLIRQRPPSALSTIPVRRWVQLIPAAEAGSVAASHARHTPARKPSPVADDSSSSSSPRSP
jgi:hypothetical protein